MGLLTAKNQRIFESLSELFLHGYLLLALLQLLLSAFSNFFIPILEELLWAERIEELQYKVKKKGAFTYVDNKLPQQLCSLGWRIGKVALEISASVNDPEEIILP